MPPGWNGSLTTRSAFGGSLFSEWFFSRFSRSPDCATGFDSSYRIFFSEDNPQLQAFDALQNIYTKDDNVMIILTAEEGTIYEEEFLEAVQWVTTQGWQIPYSRRVA